MMNGSSPLSASGPVAPSGARYDGGLVAWKSGMSCPTHRPCSSSHQTYALRSDHGLPSGSADALVHAVGVHAGVDPAAADGRAVRLQLQEAAQRPPGGDVVAVDLLEHV